MGARTFQEEVRLGLKKKRSKCEDRGAKIAEGVESGEGCPLPQPTRVYREASWAPPAGYGVEPGPPMHFKHILWQQNAAGGDKNSIYLK